MADAAQNPDDQDGAFTRFFDRIVRRFWADDMPMSEDELQHLVEAEGLTYPANHQIRPARRLGETNDQFLHRLGVAADWVPVQLTQQKKDSWLVIERSMDRGQGSNERQRTVGSVEALKLAVAMNVPR